MARLNVKTQESVYTHEGAPAWGHVTPEQALRRSVLSCLLWEREYYEDGQAIVDRITENAKKVSASTLAALAIEARSKFNLRHVPLLLVSILADTCKGSPLVAETIPAVVQRADELAELLAVFAAYKSVRPSEIKKVLTHGMRRGLAKAFGKFNAYGLAKYNRDNGIKLRDVLFLSHAKPKDEEQKALWKSLIDGTLSAPDTWEVELSAGKDKRETFERLIREENIGYLALIRNLRNMEQAGVDVALVKKALIARKGASRVFPFRFVAAAKAAPKFEEAIDAAFLAEMQSRDPIPGKTVVVVDVSGSMYGSKMSAKSDMDRATVACALAAIMRELATDCAVYATAGSDTARKHATQLVPPRRGMAMVDAVHSLCRPLGGGGIFLKQVCDFLREKEKDVDRMIVITDEQDCGIGHGDSPLSAKPIGKRNYLINVASAENGVGYTNGWEHIDGFSENVVRFIHEFESQNDGRSTQ